MRSQLVTACFLVIALLSTSASAQDTVENLKKEVELLKREVQLLTKERDSLKAEVDKLQGKAPAAEKPVVDGGEFNGVLWEITVLATDGKPLATRKMLAQDGRVYVQDKEIGTYTQDGPRVELNVTGAPQNKANGVYRLVQAKTNPPSYRGTLRNVEGNEFRLQIRHIKD